MGILPAEKAGVAVAVSITAAAAAAMTALFIIPPLPITNTE